MKKSIKILPFVLSAMFMFGACTPNNQGAETPAVNPQTPTTEHLQTKNTLHKVTVTETNKPFVVNGESDYKILVPFSQETTIVTAANYFAKYIKMATGCQLPVEALENYTWNANEKWIVFGRDDLFAAAGLTMPTEDIGISGYYIKSVGNSVFVAVEEVFGYKRAALSLLDHIVGYEMYWNDTVVFEKTGATLPEMEIIERPDFAFYQESNQISGDGKYGMGFDSSIWISVEGAPYHNSFKYLPKATYQATHSKWYSKNDQGVKGNASQLCYNAQGDPNEWQKMVEEVAGKIISYADASPNLATITFTQEDTKSWCGCDTCMEMKEQYNGSNAASAVKFINAVDNIVQSTFERRAEESGKKKRQLNILIFAYRETEVPPVKKNADGSYSAVDATVKCNPNVGVYYAPIESNYQESFYSDANAYARENARGWGAICQNIYVWIYDTNFHYYFFPLNTWGAKVETYRFLKENNAYYMHSQSQWNNGAVTHFSRFKDYIDAKASFDVNVDYNKLKDDFFNNYYGPAAEPMRKFFDELESYMEYLSVKYPSNVLGNYKENIGTIDLWPKRVLGGFMDYVNEAYEAVESIKESNPAMYEVYKEHVLLESMFPRYALLSFYKGTYNDEEFHNEAFQFKMDCSTLGITRHNEEQTIDAIWRQWGV